MWTGKKEIGPHKEVLLTKECERFGYVVYDLKWKLRYIHKKGSTSHTITITERANKWDLRRVIRRIEKNVLPLKIKELIEECKSTNSVK